MNLLKKNNKDKILKKMANKVASKVLVCLGYFFGPLFPTIGMFIHEGVKSWLGWTFLVICILAIGSLSSVTTSSIEYKNSKINNNGIIIEERKTSPGAILSILLTIIYLGFLIYATIVVFHKTDIFKST